MNGKVRSALNRNASRTYRLSRSVERGGSRREGKVELEPAREAHSGATKDSRAYTRATRGVDRARNELVTKQRGAVSAIPDSGSVRRANARDRHVESASPWSNRALQLVELTPRNEREATSGGGRLSFFLSSTGVEVTPRLTKPCKSKLKTDCRKSIQGPGKPTVPKLRRDEDSRTERRRQVPNGFFSTHQQESST